MKKTLALAVIIVFLTLNTAYALDSNEIVGNPAPDFFLKDLKGSNVSIASSRGKVVVLVFWASWCPPCKDEMPSLNKLYGLYRGKGLVVLGISAEKSIKDVREFVDKNALRFPVMLDEDLRTTRKYRVLALPSTFLIDKSGIVVERLFPVSDWTSPEYIKKVEELLK